MPCRPIYYDSKRLGVVRLDPETVSIERGHQVALQELLCFGNDSTHLQMTTQASARTILNFRAKRHLRDCSTKGNVSTSNTLSSNEHMNSIHRVSQFAFETIGNLILDGRGIYWRVERSKYPGENRCVKFSFSPSYDEITT
jgi:hypothetical protein